MNDHFAVALPERTVAIVEVKASDGAYHAAGRVEFGAKQKLVVLKAAR